MEFKRILSALLGFPLVLAILIFGNKYVVNISFVLVAILSLHEFFQAFRKVSKPIQYVRIFIYFTHSFS